MQFSLDGWALIRPPHTPPPPLQPELQKRLQVSGIPLQRGAIRCVAISNLQSCSQRQASHFAGALVPAESFLRGPKNGVQSGRRDEGFIVLFEFKAEVRLSVAAV